MFQKINLIQIKEHMSKKTMLFLCSLYSILNFQAIKPEGFFSELKQDIDYGIETIEGWIKKVEQNKKEIKDFQHKKIKATDKKIKSTQSKIKKNQEKIDSIRKKQDDHSAKKTLSDHTKKQVEKINHKLQPVITDRKNLRKKREVFGTLRKKLKDRREVIHKEVDKLETQLKSEHKHSAEFKALHKKIVTLQEEEKDIQKQIHKNIQLQIPSLQKHVMKKQQEIIKHEQAKLKTIQSAA